MIILLPVLATSGLYTMTTRLGNKRILRSQYNEGFIFKHGFCPAGKWKLPKEGQETKVSGIFKPHFDSQVVEFEEVIVAALKGNLVLKSVETGEEIPPLPQHQRREIFQRQLKAPIPA